MPFLILRSEDSVVRRILLDHEKPLTIGVLPDNDIVIDDPSVSGHHAEIEAEDGLFFITDRQSRNGTFINDELILSRALTQGDIISLGEHTLEFGYEKGETIPSDSDIMKARMTMMIDTHQHRSRLARSISRLAREEDRKQTVAVLSYMDGSGRSYKMEEFPIKIGKATENHIRIKGFGIGKTAAIIHRKDNEYRLSAAMGRNRPKVNYKTVKNETRLGEFDVIEIGSSQFQFHFQSVDASGDDSP